VEFRRIDFETSEEEEGSDVVKKEGRRTLR
jgi:hypothetical protein